MTIGSETAAELSWVKSHRLYKDLADMLGEELAIRAILSTKAAEKRGFGSKVKSFAAPTDSDLVWARNHASWDFVLESLGGDERVATQILLAQGGKGKSALELVDLSRKSLAKAKAKTKPYSYSGDDSAEGITQYTLTQEDSDKVREFVARLRGAKVDKFLNSVEAKRERNYAGCLGGPPTAAQKRKEKEYKSNLETAAKGYLNGKVTAKELAAARKQSYEGWMSGEPTPEGKARANKMRAETKDSAKKAYARTVGAKLAARPRKRTQSEAELAADYQDLLRSRE